MSPADATENHPRPLPLQGIRILTLAHLYPGPMATMFLADLGADVVIVEGPGAPDRTRRFPGHFEAFNRNKRAVSIDLKTEAGCQAFLQLADTADVIIEGFRPGVMDRLGLSPATLRRRNPRLVCMSISGFGQNGPLAKHAAHDLSLQGLAGMLNIPPGEEDSHPLPPLVLADIASANAAALGVVTALLQRERTSHAATVDVAMLDCLVAWMAPTMVPLLNGLAPARLPPTDPGYGVFLSADGCQFTLSISGEDHLWWRLCVSLELDPLKDLSEEERIRRRAEVVPALREAIGRQSYEALSDRLDRVGVPYAPVLGPLQVHQHPQVIARQLMVEQAVPDNPPLRYVRQPLVFDGVPTSVHRRAPALGEHNDELLAVSGPTRDGSDRLERA